MRERYEREWEEEGERVRGERVLDSRDDEDNRNGLILRALWRVERSRAGASIKYPVA